MKSAFGISLTNSVRKTQDPKDIVNYQIWVPETRYYSKDADRLNGQYPKTVRLARPMSQECAKNLATQLRGVAQKIEVIEIIADDDQYLPETLEELKSPEDAPPGILALKFAVEDCLKSGMPGSEVLDIYKSEIRGAERLRVAIQECLKDKRIKNEDILLTVNRAVQG